MTGVSKEDVLTWFQDLNASQRLELICALLDHSLPFELRFLGSVIENLGRKDFHVLRDAECKANSLHSTEATQDPATILKFLAEGPSIGGISVQTGNAGNSSSSTSANPTMQAANVGDVSVTRPGSSLKSDHKGLSGDGSKSTPESVPVENGIASKSTSAGGNVVSPDTKSNERSTGRLNHKGDGISDEENDSKRDVWLYNQTKRRKLILYLSLLQATNHDSANSYYLLLSDVEDLMDKDLDWLDDLEEMNQDEILLLYTISSQHPAFTFEQRSLLSTVLNRFREYLPRYSKSYVQGFPNSSSPLPNQILNHLYIPPQQFDKGVIYPVYCPTAQLVQQPIPSSQSANPQPGTATDAVRPIAYSLNSYPYPSYQVFMPAPNHGSVNHHPQQFPTHPFPQNATAPHLSMQSPVVPPNGLPTQVAPIPPSTLPLPSQSPVGVGAAASQKSHATSTVNPSGSTQSHQSSISTPTRTSSMASAVTAYQSQENSLDGDSEGSCAWDSPESSPFESPPQSLTPSRSQSPRTGTQNTKNVHMSSLNLSSPSSTISCHGSTHTMTNSTSQPCLKADGLPGLHQICVQQTRPVHKSQSTQERKSRTSTSVVSGHNSGGQASNNLPCTSAASSPSLLPMTNPPPSSLANVAATTVTSSAPSITSPVSRTQQCSSSCNHPINPANPGQCPNVNTPAQASPLCSNVNASTSAVTTGDSAPNSLSISISNKTPSTASYSAVSGNVSAGSIATSSSANVLNSVNTSAYGNSVVLNPVSSSPTYPLVTLQHHATSHNPLATVAASNSYTGCVESFYNGNSSTGLIAATTGYGNVLKGSPSSMHSQSSQGRQSKSNASPNNPQQLQNTVIVHQAPTPSQQQHIMQQLMQQQLVNQMQSPSGQAVNAVTHSMNTPLLAYGHPSGLTSHGGHVSYSGYPSSAGMNFGGLGGPGYRPGTQVSMIGRSNAFIPAHPGQMLNNSLAMKQEMRNHVSTGHNSLRQKNPSVGMPNQNTPKRRTTPTAPNNSSSASNSLNQSNGKEESSDIGDRTNNVMVVSANPTKSQQDTRGRIYHHPNSKYSNGPLVPDRNATSYSGQANTNQLINSPSGNPGLSLHNVQSKSEDIVPNDSGMSEYNVSTSQVSPYPSNLPVYGHPGSAYIVPNGYLPYYHNPIGGTGAGPQGPPPTEILMNPGHMHPQYPYTSYPFAIPQSNYNIGLSKQNMSASNSVGKDSSKGGTDVSKGMTSLNDLSFGRPGPPSNSQSSGTGSTVSSSGIVAMPSHSPLSNHAGRRGVILEVGGQASGSEFQGPNLAALENALMPPLDDPLDVNCRPRKISCYNCGSNNHVGPECKEASMEEMTRKQYRLNYGGPSADNKDGD